MDELLEMSYFPFKPGEVSNKLTIRIGDSINRRSWSNPSDLHDLVGKSCQILYRVVARGGSKDHSYVGWQTLEEELLQKHRCIQRPGHLATVPYGGAFARVSCHPTAQLAEFAGVIAVVKQWYAL